MVDIFYSRQACNTYIVFNENNEGFLVDPGYNANNVLIDHIKKLNINLKAILITHGHFDHIGALEDILNLFPEIPVYIHEEEAEFLTNPKLNLSIEASEWLGKVLDYNPKNIKTLLDNEEFEVAGFKINCLHTPFHTKGSSSYLVSSEKEVFTGDSLFYMTVGRTDLPTGSNRTLESSLLKLKKLPDELKVYPGHGVVTSLEREKKYNHYLRNI